MSETKLSFKRYEKKYLLSSQQYQVLMERLEPYIRPDEYPSGLVCSVYYDSEDYRLIRHSLDRPVYKEKLRLRSYRIPGPEDEIFVELKKKYKGIVYKRRITMPQEQAVAWLAGKGRPDREDQMTREVDWFLAVNHPFPRSFIACDRTAWRAKEDEELRITFDENIRWRQEDLSLSAGDGGHLLTQPGQVLMELKLPEAAPLWLAHLLSELQLYPTSFSKYGIAYRDNILKETINGVISHA